MHKLNVVTNECLYRALGAVKAGDRLMQIARAVEGHAKAHGYGIVQEYSGHGVGFELHESPSIPNSPHGPNPKMNNGMVFAIEPMINLGTGDVEVLDDHWTVVTADERVSAHWEHTVVIHNGQTEVLTERLEDCTPGMNGNTKN